MGKEKLYGILQVMGVALIWGLSAGQYAEAAPKDIMNHQRWRELNVAPGQGADGGICAVLPVGTPAVFAYVEPTDWRDYYAVEFELKLPDERIYEIQMKLRFDYNAFYQAEGTEVLYPPEAVATAIVAGNRWHHIAMRRLDFATDIITPGLWEYVKGAQLSGRWLEDATTGKVLIDNLALTKTSVIAVSSEVRSLPGRVGTSVTYPLTVENSSTSVQW